MWAAAEFEDSGEKTKFLKLMGAFKGKGAEVSATSDAASADTVKPKKTPAGMDLESQKQLLHNLEKEFSTAARHQGSKSGLGSGI